MTKRAHWYNEHPPYCTCFDCQEAKTRKPPNNSVPQTLRNIKSTARNWLKALTKS